MGGGNELTGGREDDMAEINRRVLLKRRPHGMPVPEEDFSVVDFVLPEPEDGQVLLRGIYLSLDPYLRGRISGVRSYARPVEIGEVIEGQVVGQSPCARAIPNSRGRLRLGRLRLADP